MTLVVTDQILRDISQIIVHKNLQTPMCFEFIHMPRCNIKQISHAIKLQYMHMDKLMTVILQGGIIQSILDAIKDGVGSVKNVAFSVLEDINKLEKCLGRMDNQLTLSVTYGIHKSYIYPIQLPYPPKYTRN